MGTIARHPTARYTLAQMRRSTGRLAAAAVAIMISTAFVVVALLAGDVATRTTYDMVAAKYADGDLVVTTSGTAWRDDLEAVRAADGVTAARALLPAQVQLGNGDDRAYAPAVVAPSDQRLLPLDLTEGAWPTTHGQIALSGDLAERLGLSVGDTVETGPWKITAPQGGDEHEATGLRVVGLADDPYGAYAQSGGAVVLDPGDAGAWFAEQWPGGDPLEIVAVLEPATLHDGEPAAGIRDTLATAAASPGDVTVKSVRELAEELAAEKTGGENLVFLVLVLTFAAVALVVAGLVIANTFQVLVVQRTRTLALLRCIGAGRGQLYRSMLLEAAVLGVLASLGGVVAGAALAQLTLLLAPGLDVGVPLPATIEITPAVVAAPLLTGTTVTVLAALAPARSATRVAPLEALQPSGVPRFHRGAGRARVALTVLATGAGFALLGTGAWLGTQDGATTGLAVGVAGGTTAFIGVVLGAVLWSTPLTALLGRLTDKLGATARLAGANTRRNPRRTAATSSALLIGVTLVVMMSTGAASARSVADTSLAERYPVDLQVYPTGTELPERTADHVAALPPVDRAIEVRNTSATVDGEDFYLRGAEPADLRALVNDPAAIDGLSPGTILLTDPQTTLLDVTEGDTVEVTGPGDTTPLTVTVTSNEHLAGLVTRADLDTIDPDAARQIWASVDPDADPIDALSQTQESLATQDVLVVGPVAARAGYERMVDVVLGLVLGLLAVAIAIAIVGVANTLSLSVVERTRENAMLRAIGMSTRQLRGTLAVEGVLVAGVGAVAGIVLGLVFGWAGSVTALSVMGDVTFTIPWTQLIAVLAVALVAGLIASVLPARRAVRTSPVEALAAE
ncbi:FtsX-like permease family protein [Myceligenerans halotolerans]